MISQAHSPQSLALWIGILLSFSACKVGPDYERPLVETPTVYKEKIYWKPAEPQEVSRDPWWLIFKDPLLNELEKQVDVSNQNIKAAEAAYRLAIGVLDATIATLYPTVNATGSGVRSRINSAEFFPGGPSGSGIIGVPNTSGSTIGNQFITSLAGTWTIDLWGQIRRSIEGAEASVQVSAANLAAARLSAQATLAVSYFQLRTLDEMKRLLDATVAHYARSLKITRNKHTSDVAALTDVAQAEVQLDNAKAQAINVGVQRAQLEHAIAVLIGKPPGEFRIPVGKLSSFVPSVPVGVPSTLLERRPDIAAAERTMASANAQIGVAISAFFPSLILNSSYGFAGSVLRTLFQASNSIWSVGPQLALTVFDAGARSAKVDQARATYDQAVATYRQTVLAAFQQVEDQLAAVRILADQAKFTKKAVVSSQTAERMFFRQYKGDLVDYTGVVVAQVASLSAQQTDLTVYQNRLVAIVSLIQALGGGWNTSQLPKVYRWDSFLKID